MSADSENNQLIVVHKIEVSLDSVNDSITSNPVYFNQTEVDLSTDADVTISAVPCKVAGIYVNAVFSAHAVNLLDGATTKLILPASLAAGSFIDFKNAVFSTSLILNSNDAATGKVVVFWKEI